MAMSVQQGDLPQEENTMKRLFAGTLALVMTCGLLFSGCGKQMTPEEEAASQEAAISQQLQDEENKTGLKRLISNNLTEYEQPVHDFIEGLQDGDAEKTAMALGVPNTFGEKLQDWVVVNDFETFQKTDMTNICLNSAKEGSKAVINVFMKTPGEVTADTSPDYTLTAEYTNGAWVLNPPTGILTDYSFTVPNNKVSFQGTDLSSYTAKNAETGVWTVTLPRALDLDSDAAYVISTDMGDFNGRVYQVAADGNKKQMLLADIDSDTRDAYQSKLSAVMKEVYRLLSIGAGESDFSNVLLDSNEISNCVPEPVDSDDDVEAIQANADKKALGASVTSITVTPDDTIEGYPDAYTYRLDGNDGVKMNVKLKVSTTNGDAHMKATIGIGKLHLSFVAHTGRQNGCKQTDFIEAALDVEGSSGAIYLAEAVLNGMMGQKRIQAIKKAKETQAKYPEELFVYNGGSPARNDRPVMWRQISLIPGTKSAYVFQAVEAEGIQNQMGGYQKKPDAEVKRILVSCSKEDLIGLAGAFKMHWTAYLSNAERYTQHMTNHREAPAAASDAPVQAPAPAVTQAPPAPVQNVNIPDTAYTIYDSIGNWMRVAGTPERALEMLQNAITTMKTKDGYVRRDNKEYEAAKEMILSGAKKGFNTITLYNGDKAVQLYVTVCPYVL